MLVELRVSGALRRVVRAALRPRKALAACLLFLMPGIVSGSSLFPSLTEPVRQEIARVEAELASLPVFPMSTSPWTMGYTSDQKQKPTLPVRIWVHFPEPEAIDLVALMPGSFTDQRNQVQSWGFPVRFKIERLLPGGGKEMIADYLERDYPKPGLDPQFFVCPDPVPTVGLQVTVTKPAANPTWWKTSHIVSLSELYAFAGEKNVALNAEVKANSNNELGFLWSTRCLTDGFTYFSPIFHDLEDPENNIIGHGVEELEVSMDLGKSCPIDQFHLWPVVHQIQHNYPPSSGIGFPSSIRLEVSQSTDFSESEVIYENTNLEYRPGAGPFMHRTRPAKARFLRFTFANGLPSLVRREPGSLARIALSEIEILGNGRIQSRGAVVQGLQLLYADRKRAANLTDGRSNEGKILPLREWLIQFKKRTELEATLASLRLDLDAAQHREEGRFRTLLLVAVGLIALLLQLIWLVRVAARRRGAQIRERIACDLHDEIGANVSSMAHTAELIAETIKEPTPTQTRLLMNMVQSARLTSRETKHFIRFIEAENHSHDIAEQLVQVADQILGTIATSFTLENTRSFNALDPTTKWNLLLFYKEALNNIIKHADADAVTIMAWRQGRELLLEIADNGRGMAAEPLSCRHLEERAAMLRGKLETESQPGKGTRITLRFKHRRKT